MSGRVSRFRPRPLSQVRTDEKKLEPRRNPSGIPAAIPEPTVARAKGSEPLAFGFVAQIVANSGRIRDCQPFLTARNNKGRRSQPSQPFRDFRRQFVTRLLPEKRREAGATPRLLTVRDAAKALSVSSATVYALCKRGEIPHVRVSNAIRIPALVFERARAKQRQRTGSRE
jgi:excisionase family DNA binding protein